MQLWGSKAVGEDALWRVVASAGGEMTDTEKALRAVLPKARTAAAKGGTMHAAWDAIFDAEALLEGKETLLRFGSREEGVTTLYDMLKVYEEGVAR